MIKRGKVFSAITTERKYQDVEYVDAHFKPVKRSVGEELVLMQVYLNKAFKSYADEYGDAPALHRIRQVAALAVRCMENHGALPREEKKKE